MSTQRFLNKYENLNNKMFHLFVFYLFQIDHKTFKIPHENKQKYSTDDVLTISIQYIYIYYTYQLL